MTNFIENLEGLCLQPGISGYEQESGMQEYLFEIINKINQNTRIDSTGNIISVVENPGDTIILEAHMDEVGFLVEKINKEIILSPIGIIKGEKVVDNNVFVVGKNLEGRISINQENEFVYVPKDEKDIKNIEIGNLVAFQRSFYVNGNEVKASALDNKIGCTVLIEILSLAIKNQIKSKLVFVFSRKEEVDDSIFEDVVNSNKDAFAIVVDAAYARPSDFDMDNNALIPIIGEGCAVQTSGKGFVVLEEDITKIKNIAINKNIKIQEEKAPIGFGKTNLAKLQNQGIKKGIVINIPVRNQHNQLSTTNILDAGEAIKMIWEIVN